MAEVLIIASSFKTTLSQHAPVYLAGSWKRMVNMFGWDWKLLRDIIGAHVV